MCCCFNDFISDDIPNVERVVLSLFTGMVFYFSLFY